MVEDTKQSHTSSEFCIIKGYLLRGDIQIPVLDHRPLHERGTETESSSGKVRPEARELLHLKLLSDGGPISACTQHLCK